MGEGQADRILAPFCALGTECHPGVCGSFWESFGVRLAPFSLVVGTNS